MLPPVDVVMDASIAAEHKYVINYRVFDLETLCELRLNLIEFLRERD